MARPQQEAIDTFISITGADEAVAIRKLEVSPKPPPAPLPAQFPLVQAPAQSSAIGWARAADLVAPGMDRSVLGFSPLVWAGEGVCACYGMELPQQSRGLSLSPCCLPLLKAMVLVQEFEFHKQEHAGDLNQAVNAHFTEGDSTVNAINQSIPPVNHDDMELDGPLDNTFQRPLFPEALHDPFALMDPNFQQMFFDSVGSAGTPNRDAQGPHPREICNEVNDNNIHMGPSGQASVVENVTGHGPSYGPEVRETIIIDDDEEELSSGLSSQHASIRSNASQPNPLPTAPPLVHVTDNDIEEEMIRAAIEASKREAEELANTAEQERTQHMGGINLEDRLSDEDMETAAGTVRRQGLGTGRSGTTMQPADEESSDDEIEDVEEQPLVRRRSRRIPSGDTESTEPVLPGDSPPSSSQPQNLDHQYNRTDFPSEWGGISSEEHDEAVMLEAAMFGGIPEAPTYPLSVPSHASSSHYPQVVHSPPPELTEQRLLREQQILDFNFQNVILQDDEYLASLQADQEKEMKTLQEAELRLLEEAAAREAALEKQKQEEEERRKMQLEKEELESNLAAKEASLPLEPPSDKEGVITLVVRMPDGSRQGRRFLKSDKFKSLFDFLDVGRTCKPETYRLGEIILSAVQTADWRIASLALFVFVQCL
ncbi:FAS-associated factor 2-B [Triticum urartu]|uniref:FAS-associated factor 2-B n=1 Tax=Triticum urartu TaxID=4572 RepID=M7Z802_TRIUA|nr:FAS-associated factor 2-B [Triticum urartu]